jgi:anti-sigma factor RsiW
MNHQPFKEWLLSEEPLSSEQTQALQDHLRSCESCRQLEAAWTDVDTLFQRLPETAPAPGFTNRWQERLAAQHLQKQRRQAWTALGATALVAVLLLTLLGIQVLSVLRSPSQLLLLWISQVTSLYSVLYALQGYVQVLFRVVPVVPITGAILALGIFSFLSVLWIVTYHQIVIVRRFSR